MERVREIQEKMLVEHSSHSKKTRGEPQAQQRSALGTGNATGQAQLSPVKESIDSNAFVRIQKLQKASGGHAEAVHSFRDEEGDAAMANRGLMNL